MSKGIKNIDELFREKLNSDMPVFRDEYWHGFEQALNNVPPVQPDQMSAPTDGGSGSIVNGSGSMTTGVNAGATAGVATSSGTVSGMLASGLVVKGILAIGTVIMLSTATWLGVTESQKESVSSPLMYPSTPIVKEESPEKKTDSVFGFANTAGFIADENPNALTSSEEIHSEAGTAVSGENTTKVAKSQPAKVQENRINPTIENVSRQIPGAGKKTTTNPVLSGTNQELDLPKKISGMSEQDQPDNSSGFIPEDRLFVYSEEVNDILAEIDSNAFLMFGDNKGKDSLNLSAQSIQQELLSEQIPTDILSDSNTKSPAVDSVAIAPHDNARNKGSVPKVVNPKRFGIYLLPGAAFANTFGNTGNFKSKTNSSLYIGAGFEFRLSKKLAIYLEPGVHRLSGLEINQTSEVSYTFFTKQQFITTIQNREMEVITLPLFLRYKQGIHTLSAGPSLLYLISTSGELEKTDISPEGVSMNHEKADNYISGFNRTQLGISLEYSLNVFQQHAAFIRYTQYLTGVSKTAPEFSGYPDAKLKIFYVGFRINAF
jgi:hypothetical protein